MWYMIWPILLVVGSSTFYNISAKSIPTQANAFASLSITYFVGSILCIILFFVTGNQKNILTEYAKLNWTSFVLGMSIVGLEFGYINIYRAGWKVNTAPLVVNVILVCLLLIIGLLLYKESISLRQIVGIAVCAIGLFLIIK